MMNRTRSPWRTVSGKPITNEDVIEWLNRFDSDDAGMTALVPYENTVYRLPARNVALWRSDFGSLCEDFEHWLSMCGDITNNRDALCEYFGAAYKLFIPGTLELDWERYAEDRFECFRAIYNRQSSAQRSDYRRPLSEVIDDKLIFERETGFDNVSNPLLFPTRLQVSTFCGAFDARSAHVYLALLEDREFQSRINSELPAIAEAYVTDTYVPFDELKKIAALVRGAILRLMLIPADDKSLDLLSATVAFKMLVHFEPPILARIYELTNVEQANPRPVIGRIERLKSAKGVTK